MSTPYSLEDALRDSIALNNALASPARGHSNDAPVDPEAAAPGKRAANETKSGPAHGVRHEPEPEAADAVVSLETSAEGSGPIPFHLIGVGPGYLVPTPALKSAAIIHTLEEQWLMRRRTLVTASEVAMILGAHPTKGPLEVYAQKRGLIEFEDNALTRRGRRFQRPIAEEYAEETGRNVIEWPQHEVTIHPDIPWLGATRDFIGNVSVAAPAPKGVVIDVPSRVSLPVEIKNQHVFMAGRWSEEAPVEYQIQLQIQIFVDPQPMGTLAALIGGLNLVWADYAFERDFIVAALPNLERFWWCVQRGQEPTVSPEWMARSLDTIKALHPKDDGATIELPADTLTLVEQWEAAKDKRDEFGDAAKALEAEIRLRIGDATTGTLPDGTSMTLKTTSRDGYVVEATSYRTLRRFVPKGLKKKTSKETK